MCGVIPTMTRASKAPRSTTQHIALLLDASTARAVRLFTDIGIKNKHYINRHIKNALSPN